jgi:hypothetical protein
VTVDTGDSIVTAAQRKLKTATYPCTLESMQEARSRLPRVPQPFPRLLRELERRADAKKLARILVESGEAAPTATTITRVSHADPDRLRGLPAVGRGCSSTMPGTDPLRALLAKERRR